tara:strand:- start:40 stop:159 length:120 start_codon:yes stop_codon:yes gene_type:complete
MIDFLTNDVAAPLMVTLLAGLVSYLAKVVWEKLWKGEED